MSRTILGKVCVTPKGTWDENDAYDFLDIVADGGGSYLAIQNVPAGTATSNTSYWLCIAEKGDKGDKGDTGATGATGATGNGIASVTKTGTSGLVDTYTITYTNGNTTTFTVTNGNGISTIVKTSTSGLVDTYTITFTNGTTTTFTVTNGEDAAIDPTLSIEGEAAEAKAVGDALANKANVDGDYDTLGSGTADNLKTNLMEQNSYPFNLAPTGGLGKVIEASNRLFLRKVIYGSVVVNQKAQEINSTNWSAESGVTATFDDSEIVFSTATASNGVKSSFGTGTDTPIASRKFLVAFDAKCETSGDLTTQLGSTNSATSLVSVSTSYVRKYVIISTGASASAARIYFYANASNLNKQFSIKNVNVIDLTQWYGSTETADHIYAMETAHTGDGVNFFVTQHPQASGYIPYNAGTLCSSKPSFHKTTGTINWFDITTNYLENKNASGQSANYLVTSHGLFRVLPNTLYRLDYADGTNIKPLLAKYIHWYDIDGNLISSANNYDTNTAITEATSPTNAYFAKLSWYATPSLAVSVIENAKPCLTAHYDNTMNGVYEQFVEHSYPFDSTASGNGVFKFKKVGGVLTDELYADGDEYAPDGTLTARYGIVDLGTLEWTASTSGDIQGFYTYVDEMDRRELYPKAICEKLTMLPQGYNTLANFLAASSDKTIALYYSTSGSHSYIWARDDSCADASAFTTAMNGVHLVYPLATPTTASKDPYTEEQACDNWGYEYYNDAEYDAGNRAVQIPVGNVTDYPANLKDKVEAYPDLPADDGDYILNKNGSSYTFKKLGSAFPTMPTTDGTYSLKATVSSGTATMSWVADT